MKLIVTRPEPEASHTAARLRQMGHEPLLCPVLNLAPKPLVLPQGSLTGLVATSPNAIRFLDEPSLARLRDIALYHTGQKTADIAAARGFSTLVHLGETVDDLVGRFHEMEPQAGLYLYLAGEVRTRELQHDLQGEGITFALVETYRAEAAKTLSPAVRAALAEGAGMLLYSRRSAEVFLHLAAADIGPGALFFSLSEKIAAVIEKAAPGADIRIAAQPTEEALLALLAT